MSERSQHSQEQSPHPSLETNVDKGSKQREEATTDTVTSALGKSQETQTTTVNAIEDIQTQLHEISSSPSVQNNEQAFPLENYFAEKRIAGLGVLQLKPTALEGSAKKVTALGIFFKPNGTNRFVSLGLAPAPLNAEILVEGYYDKGIMERHEKREVAANRALMENKNADAMRERTPLSDEKDTDISVEKVNYPFPIMLSGGAQRENGNRLLNFEGKPARTMVDVFAELEKMDIPDSDKELMYLFLFRDAQRTISEIRSLNILHKDLTAINFLVSDRDLSLVAMDFGDSDDLDTSPKKDKLNEWSRFVKNLQSIAYNGLREKYHPNPNHIEFKFLEKMRIYTDRDHPELTTQALEAKLKERGVSTHDEENNLRKELGRKYYHQLLKRNINKAYGIFHSLGNFLWTEDKVEQVDEAIVDFIADPNTPTVKIPDFNPK